MNKEEKIEAWITKYALTQGILKRRVKISKYTSGMVSEYISGYLHSYHGSDWHRTHKSALKKAEEMRLKKIINLKKQLAKVRALTF